MKLISLALTCIAIALLASGCTETATPTNTSTPTTASSPAASPAAPTAPGDQFAAARADYAKNCEGCHGPTGEGGLVRVNDKQIKVPSLKAGHALKHTDDELVNIVTNGEEAMPSFKEKLNAAQITELVQFVRKEFQGK